MDTDGNNLISSPRIRVNKKRQASSPQRKRKEDTPPRTSEVIDLDTGHSELEEIPEENKMNHSDIQ